MELHDTASLINTREQDLEKVRGQLQEQALSGHALLASQVIAIEELPLARLLLVVASIGTYNSEGLIPVAVGLELLRLAADRHYPPLRESLGEDQNLHIISADYFYAQAIRLAAHLHNGDVIGHMVRAIAEVAGAEASMQGKSIATHDIGSKRAGLFKAAVKLGALMGTCPPGLTGPLTEFASALPPLYFAASHPAYAATPDAHRLFTGAKSRLLTELEILPTQKYRLIEELVETLIP